MPKKPIFSRLRLKRFPLSYKPDDRIRLHSEVDEELLFVKRSQEHYFVTCYFKMIEKNNSNNDPTILLSYASIHFYYILSLFALVSETCISFFYLPQSNQDLLHNTLCHTKLTTETCISMHLWRFKCSNEIS